MEIQEELAELRKATRELHEAIQDSKSERIELMKLRREINQEFSTLFQTHAMPLVIDGLAKYEAMLNQQIEKATETVFNRFQTIADILINEGKKRRANKPSLRTVAEQIKFERDGFGLS